MQLASILILEKGVEMKLLKMLHSEDRLELVALFALAVVAVTALIVVGIAEACFSGAVR
jgi:hypothetical protein